MAPFHAARPELFFAGTIPTWLPALSLNGLLAALLAIAAAERLEGFNPPGPANTSMTSMLTVVPSVLASHSAGMIHGAFGGSQLFGWH